MPSVRIHADGSPFGAGAHLLRAKLTLNKRRECGALPWALPSPSGAPLLRPLTMPGNLTATPVEEDALPATLLACIEERTSVGCVGATA
jgi:hypothetical protein